MHRLWRTLAVPAVLSGAGLTMTVGPMPAAAVAAAPASVVSSGTITIPGTWTLNLDSGKLIAHAPFVGIWWDIYGAGDSKQKMVPLGGGGLHNLGVIPFSSYGPIKLKALTYGTTPISGNRLGKGDVFADHTNTNHFAKVQVLSYGYDLKVTWVTYS